MKNTTLFGVSSSFAVIGLIFYAFSHHYLFFAFPTLISQTHSDSSITSRKVTIFFPSYKNLSPEFQDITSCLTEEQEIELITNRWLLSMYEEQLIPKKTILQSALYNPSHTELFLSFDHNIFFKESSVQEKYALIEALCTTLRENNKKVSFVRFLVNHQPIKDHSLDFTLGWPVEGFSAETLSSSTPFSNPLTIILDPAGNSFYTGRTIDEHFERTVTLFYAQALKKALESHNPSLRIIITRSLNTSNDPLYNASFANRLGADVYISINFYKTYALTPQWHLYYFMNNTFLSSRPSAPSLQLLPYYYAHEQCITRTYALVKQWHHVFKTYSLHHFYTLFAPQSLPFKPLVGIGIPALAFEIGLTKSEDWKLFVEPVVEAITTR